jgi:hypothetical protein
MVGLQYLRIERRYYVSSILDKEKTKKPPYLGGFLVSL